MGMWKYYIWEKAQLQKQNENKNGLCSCSLGKDLGIVLNEKLNMKQQYFTL